MKRYSLADYIVSISSNDQTLRSLFGTISIGGEGSYVGSITVSTNSDLFSTTGYHTGAWVHNKNLDRTGSCQIQLNQLSSSVQKLIKFINLMYSGNYDGATVTVTDIAGNKVATCIDSYIQKQADQSFGNEAADQTWSFTCGKVVLS